MNLKVMFFFVCTFLTNTLFSQENTNSSSEIRMVNTNDLPYLNYKGIKDLDEAKKAWITDHPELNLIEKNEKSIITTEIPMSGAKTEAEMQNQSDVVVESENVYENQPYLNYKRIRNPKEARKIWMIENPEAAEKLNEKLQQSGSSSNAATKVFH